MISLHDAISQFRDAMQNAGLEPPLTINPGEIYRFPGIGKQKGNTAGWCRLFDDLAGGCFGDWSSGLSAHWQANHDASLSLIERDALKRRIIETQKKIADERNALQAAAATKAAEIWKAAPLAPVDHPYLVRKKIEAYGVRSHNGALVVAARIGDKLHSLQFIDKDGNKKFLPDGKISGCYFSIGNTKGAVALCISEGFATGASVHHATALPVAVAFNSGNLKAVALAMRQQFPSLRLIVCADDDSGTKGNPGLTKAREAAIAVSGLLAVPDFGNNKPPGASDFNDMANIHGDNAVREAINDAVTAEDILKEEAERWQSPHPLTMKMHPEPYPLDALPNSVRSAVEEVQSFTKAPIVMVASSALAAMSIAIQAHYDVKRAEKLTSPVSLFLLTIADSGERKSTCDGFFSKAIHEYERNQSEVSKPIIRDYNAKIEAWEAKRAGIKDELRKLAKKKNNSIEMQNMEENLRILENNKPEAPLIPHLIYADATPEALAYDLAKHWPSGGILSTEGGIVLGAHGMGKDSVMRNLALLNILWDGGNHNITRRTSESFSLRGVRLTIAIQIQALTLMEFFNRTNGLPRGSGFLARFLFAWPESTQGYRMFTESLQNWSALDKFNCRITKILERPVSINADGSLATTMLSLSPEAKTAWITFHDAIESELISGGELFDVRDAASKIADNAVRLAALLHAFEGTGDQIGAESLQSACRIVAWHLNEAKRFFGELALPKELADAVALDKWIIRYCRDRDTNHISQRELLRHVIPGHLRKKQPLESALNELKEAGRIKIIENNRRKEIYVHPELLSGDSK